MTVLSEADPADKADVYGQLGLTLTYDPAARRVKAEARPESIMYVGTCPRGDLNTRSREISPIEGNHEVSVAGHTPHPPARSFRMTSVPMFTDLNPHNADALPSSGRTVGWVCGRRDA